MHLSLNNYCQFLRDHVRKSERNSDAASVSLRAIDKCERSIVMGSLSENDLADIVLAASDRRLGPLNIGIELLAELFVRFPNVAEAWRKLAASKHVHERWVAIIALKDSRVPIAFAEELIRLAFLDKSAKVRLFAVECILARRISSLLPEIKQLVRVEEDERILELIKQVAHLLDTGKYKTEGWQYSLTENKDGRTGVRIAPQEKPKLPEA